MAGCRYKTRVLGDDWKCPLDALPEEEHCYWHKEVDGKVPTGGQLEELRENEIFGVYLPEAYLAGAILLHACLYRANLRNTILRGASLGSADLREADLTGADLRGARLGGTNFQGAKLRSAKFQGAILHHANLPGADLSNAQLQGVSLYLANLREANLSRADLQETDLYLAKLEGANLSNVRFRGANLAHVMFNSKTNLDGADMVGANLYRSYFDETKSFRNATMFHKEGDKEINECVVDAFACSFSWIFLKIVTKVLKKLHISSPLKRPAVVLAMGTSGGDEPIIATNLRGKRLIRHVGHVGRVVFFDWSSGCAIENPENPRRRERSLTKVDELTELILKNGEIQTEFLYRGSGMTPYRLDFSSTFFSLCRGGRAPLYEASYEVYNNLYNFYVANGRLDQAAHVHYRRGEVHRKLRWARGGWTNRARSIFDLLVLRFLTGYGDKISRPLGISVLIIGLFAALFWHFDGIVKNVNNTQVAPDWIDYIYHSITTFTSLGYSNIQPNLAVGHLPQILVAAESVLGVLMMALIIFVVTYQVSR